MNVPYSSMIHNGFGMCCDDTFSKMANQSLSSLSSYGSSTHSFASQMPTHSSMPSMDGIDYASRRDPTAFHQYFLATYKVYKCKEKRCHDKRQCKYWHSKGDRRRNPFEVSYSPMECTLMVRSSCPEGDLCLRSHNMMERMFHPELYKISMCARGPNGSFCERGDLCAFAHFPEDLRVPLSRTSIAVPHCPQSIPEVQEKLIRLIKAHGSEGILSSELPKRYCETYGEKLEPLDEEGNRCRIKNILVHENIVVVMHKNVQPKYIYVSSRSHFDEVSDLSQQHDLSFSHLDSPFCSVEHLPMLEDDDDSDAVEFTKSPLDETHHTYDTVESQTTNSHDTSEFWRMKAEALEKRFLEVQRLNESFAKAYHSMHSELVSAHETINAKNKEIAMLQEYLAKASKMHAEVLRLQNQLSSTEAKLKQTKQQNEMLATNSLIEPFYMPVNGNSGALKAPPGMPPLSQVKENWALSTQARLDQ